MHETVEAQCLNDLRVNHNSSLIQNTDNLTRSGSLTERQELKQERERQGVFVAAGQGLERGVDCRF